jgi:hypothetical protein
VGISELRALTTRPTGRNGRGIFDLNQLLERLDVIHVPRPYPIQSMNWQLLETAPRDGTKLLLWGRFPTPADATASVVVGRYDHSFGWVSASAGVIPIVPTHWMPLPDAPLGARDLAARQRNRVSMAAGLPAPRSGTVEPVESPNEQRDQIRLARSGMIAPHARVTPTCCLLEQSRVRSSLPTRLPNVPSKDRVMSAPADPHP